MNQEISEDLRIMLDTVRRFIAQDLEPISRQVEEDDLIPD
ncbi:MAG: acyl-CoA dehydrogenase, partial [Deltaproteobacteria bacterium]|nr:acyl-CoA dehydrogenase [Deltaproteobacteria bacterium]